VKEPRPKRTRKAVVESSATAADAPTSAATTDSAATSAAAAGSAAASAAAASSSAAAAASPPRRKRAAVKVSYDEEASGSAAPAFMNRDLFAAGSPRIDAPAQIAPGSPPRGYGTPIEPHPGWRAQLQGIQLMRTVGGAPVDSMGCERTSDADAPPAVRRFQTLVSLMLSSQTKDEVNYAAMLRLRAQVPGGLTAANVAAAPLSLLETLIHPVSFFRNKARFIQAAGAACAAERGGDIPDSVPGLCALAGVGPKMAFICMDAAWGVCVGIGVDTHVHRIANRLAWVKTTDPKATQVHLQSWLPRSEWGALNVLLVGFGQTICTPVGPKCAGCGIRELCPTASGVAASRRAAAALQ
jgi:endonuclease-3